MLDRSVKPVYNLVDAGFSDATAEERARIRSGGVSVNKYVTEKCCKGKRKMPFKQVMKGLSTTERVLLNTAQAVDTLNEDEVMELEETLDAIKAALKLVSTKLKK